MYSKRRQTVLSAIDETDAACGMDRRAIGLCSRFFRCVAEAPGRHALEVDGSALTYEDLGGRGRAITAALLENMPDTEVPLTAVFGHRSVTALSISSVGLRSPSGFRQSLIPVGSASR